MKKAVAALAGLVFSLSMLAQNTSKPSDNQSQSNQANQSSQSTPSASSDSSRAHRMSGKVSKDAKSFTDDASGKKYTVSNPDTLQNYENQHVVILVQTDPDTGDVTITAVQPPQ